MDSDQHNHDEESPTAGKVFRSSVQLTREQARTILDGAFAQARRVDTEPITAVVRDGGDHVVVAAREDGCAPLRFPVAQGKAFAALGIGVASGVVGARNTGRPEFLASVALALSMISPPLVFVSGKLLK